MYLKWYIEPVCLGVLRELNARLSNRRNQNMIGWAKFVGLRFWISRFSPFRKSNFPLRFWYRAICKSWFRQYFLLKTKNKPPVLSLYRCVSNTLPSPYISVESILVQKHGYFILLFVPELTGLYQQNREKNRISNGKRKTRKMKIKWFTVKENTM